MSDHAKLSPSSAKRWFNCPGSANLIATLPPTAFTTSKYAAEGIVAHQLCEDFVNNKTDLITLTSRVGESVMQDGSEIEITDAMVEGVIEYVDHIASIKKRLTHPGKIVGLAEQRVICPDDLSEVYGTADYVLYQVGNELHVVDFKFGKGTVEHEDNEQGAIYLLGAVALVKSWAFDKFFFHIVQPRARHNEGTCRTWELSKEQLVAFLGELRAAVARTKDPQAPRAAGAWCKFCPAMAYCPEVKAGVEGAAATVFTALPAPPSKEVGQASLPPVATMTREQVGKALEWEASIDSWFEAVRARALAELTLDADAVPGFKLVEGKTNRAWGDEAAAESAFALLGDARYAPRKLRSPAQMEKLTDKAEVARWATKPAGKPTVAPASDKRQAIPAAGKATDVFGAIEGHVPPADGDDIFGDLAGAPKKEPMWPV